MRSCGTDSMTGGNDNRFAHLNDIKNNIPVGVKRQNRQEKRRKEYAD